MAAGTGFTLKLLQWFLRGIEFCCAAIVLALYSYFLAALSNHGFPIGNWVRAVEGISGIAVIYTALGILLVCCLAGFPLTSFLAMALDVAFIVGFIYIAACNAGGSGRCTGAVNTPFGSGLADQQVTDGGHGGGTALPTFGNACRMETACLAVSIVAIFFFLFSCITEFALARHHQKEKRFGPSPANNYTSGYGKRRGLFSRRRAKAGALDNPDALPQHTTPAEVRDSYATETTHVGTDAAGAGVAGGRHSKYSDSGYAANPGAANQGHFVTQPAGTHPALHPGEAPYYNDGVYDSRV